MPKHDTISRELRAEIACGRYGTSGRLPSEAQLAERFGVSRPTIARALRDLQAEGLIQRRAGSGSYVQPPGRIPSAAKVLGLLVPEWGTTEIFEAIWGELGALARVHGFGLLWIAQVAFRAMQERIREPTIPIVARGVDDISPGGRRPRAVPQPAVT